MSPRTRIFLSQRARKHAVNRAYAAFLDAHRRPLDRQEPHGGHSPRPAVPPLVRNAEQHGRPGGGESTQSPESHRLIPFERLLVVYAALLMALIVAGNLWHVG